ncbi:MAG: VOC family protein [Xanthomonadales bacterium]|nr:VOC family protein [Xanthomonadales bacterium]
MQLGSFSISLAVKDLAASKSFYTSLGFEVFHGDEEHNWLIMKNGDAVIGLFQGMFESNILTFNPGWDHNAQALDSFTDVRDIQKHLKEQGIALVSEADESSSGPASCITMDPDGNTILIDQHV